MRLLLLVLSLVACAPPEEAAPVSGLQAAKLDAGPSRLHLRAGRDGVLAGESPRERAEAALTRIAPSLGLSRLEGWGLARLRSLPGGATLAVFRPRVEDLPVLGGDLRMLIDRDGRLLAWSGAPLPGLRGEAARLDLADAAAVAGRALGREVQGAPSPRPDGWSELGPARVRAVAFPHRSVLRRAYEVELADEFGLWQLVVDAASGELLARRSLTARHRYRVWADADGRPADSPWEDQSPHPTGIPDGRDPAVTEAALLELEGGNAEADPWLPDEAETTDGNHAWAYTDRHDPGGYDTGELEIEVSAPGDFDWSYDFDASPTASDEQARAAAIQAFVVSNWLHDWYWDSGFDEAAGNAQADNMGRGGEEGDPLHLEMQDDAENANTRNNANMSTPADGQSPTMQMYLWSTASLEVGGSWTADVGTGGFGATHADVSAPAAEVGSDPTACAGIDAEIAGNIALIDRGDCPFVDKVGAAQDAGAVGVVLVNSEDSVFTMGGSDASLSIPAVLVSSSDGAAIRAEMASGEVELRILRREIDGALDSTVVAHEWGHYLFGRLVDGCSSTQCNGMNEGNSDLVALMMTLRDGDDLDGVYAAGAYDAQTIAEDSVYYGIRRVPYSRDPAANALSFRNISAGVPLPTSHPVSDNGYSNTESHNAGEVWASVMFHAYLDLQEAGAADGRSFTEIERRMTDILVAGLSLAPTDPTFLELRDAVLLAAAAIDPADAETLAGAFAARGMGQCAVGPDASSTDLRDIVEDYELHANPSIGEPGILPTEACDDDAFLDAGETGVVQVLLSNDGPSPLSGAELSLAFDRELGLSFPDGATVTVPEIGPFESATVEIAIAGDEAAFAGGLLRATLSTPDGCEESLESSSWVWVEADVQSAAATDDDFAADDGSWTVEGDDEIWGRVTSEGVTTWLGVDVSGITDSRLVSPAMRVGEGELLLRLSHRYSYEYSDDTAWDGGVIELSVDGGDWTDLSSWVDPGYDHVLTDLSDNPLGLRPAFSSTSAAWPDFETLELDLGTALAGSSIRVAFRSATDQAADGYGWELASFAAEGLADSPFPALVADGATPPEVYPDADGDGHGAGEPSASCAGGAASADDCDDADASVSPSAPELCGDVDDDCDGLVDEADPDLGDLPSWYPDADGDGWGDDGGVELACEGPEGSVAQGGDCDDGAATVSPGAAEVCGGGDEDCDGLEDEADPDVSWMSTFYADVDGDGHGDLGSPVEACAQPEGAVAEAGDCDDADPTVSPGGAEVCGGADEDCDGLVDEADPDVSGMSTFYLDADGDGHGDPTAPVSACAAGEGLVAAGDDCDDLDAAVSPSGLEVCGGGDEDCDGLVDEADPDVSGMSTFYLDADGDGHADPASAVQACSAGEGQLAEADDCDDGDAAVHPGAEELPADGVDQDCDGQERCPSDGDGDGHGGAGQVTSADLDCLDDGEAETGDDCDDADPAVHPGAVEDCTQPVDADCDGLLLWADADLDGWAACEECDDGDGAVNPAAAEICNGVDDDCEGSVDEGAEDAATWYVDADGDGWTGAEGVEACEAPEGYATLTELDCDDGDPGVSPGAAEIDGDGIDQDCDGADPAGGGEDSGGAGTAPKTEPGGCGCASGAEAPVVTALLALAMLRRRTNKLKG